MKRRIFFNECVWYDYRGLQQRLTWTHLNPLEVLEEVRKLKFQFPLSTMEAYMKRAGITSGYMKKPCLDPTDAHCPNTAPNKKSGHVIIHFNYNNYYMPINLCVQVLELISILYLTSCYSRLRTRGLIRQ